MTDDRQRRVRYGEVFWRAHHEAWQRSDLNQREYCAAQGIPLKAFGNRRAKFMAEPQLVAPKLLYRRGGLNPLKTHLASLSHGAYAPPHAPPLAESGRALPRLSHHSNRRCIQDFGVVLDHNLLAHALGAAGRIRPVSDRRRN